MKHKLRIVVLTMYCTFVFLRLNGQEGISAAGGDAAGSGGSAAFTCGQVFYSFISGANETINQGVQQPYEISVVTGLEETTSGDYEFLIYPNPAAGNINIEIKSGDYEALRFCLYNSSGIPILEKEAVGDMNTMSLDNLPPSLYFLKIVKKNLNIKVYKIIKK